MRPRRAIVCRSVYRLSQFPTCRRSFFRHRTARRQFPGVRFIIGVVMSLLKPIWQVGKFEESLVDSTALLASAFGAFMFGRVADMLGRKRIYGVDVLVLAAGAIGCAFAPNIWWLIGLRFVLGIGIGGDYPVSATIMSEYAGKANRGMLVTPVFTMQAAGLIVGPLFASALLTTHVSHDIIWRILVAFGALPALAVYWQRRHLKGTRVS